MVKTKCYPDPTQWNDWFAWYPVKYNCRTVGARICYDRAWLETVQRRQCGHPMFVYWEYRNKNGTGN